jgi:hypothetical protein
MPDTRKEGEVRGRRNSAGRRRRDIRVRRARRQRTTRATAFHPIESHRTKGKARHAECEGNADGTRSRNAYFKSRSRQHSKQVETNTSHHHHSEAKGRIRDRSVQHTQGEDRQIVCGVVDRVHLRTPQRSEQGADGRSMAQAGTSTRSRTSWAVAGTEKVPDSKNSSSLQRAERTHASGQHTCFGRAFKLQLH